MISSFKELVRLAVARGFAAALTLRSEPYAPAPGPILVVAPHPDDETLGAGAAIAWHAARGDAVHVIFLTDGEASHPPGPDLTVAQLGARRRAEAAAALAVLGIDGAPHTSAFLAAPDGRLDRLPPGLAGELQRELSRRIAELRPAAVFVPYEFGGSTEHTAASRLVAAALASAGGGVLLEYPIWAWWNAFRLRPRLRRGADNLRLALGPWRERKRRALACHRTQTEPLPPAREAALPPAIAAACCGAHEFFFRRRIPPALSTSPSNR